MDGPIDAALSGRTGLGDPTRPPARDPEEAEAAAGRVSADIATATTLGPVHLTVADLDRSLAYYSEAVGLRVLSPVVVGAAGRRSAALGAGERVLLVLAENPGAPAPSASSTGLYHFALLLPERVDLARWLAHAVRLELPLVGASDHFVSEALYLSDPDGHGIEIYWDRPRSLWEGQVSRMTTLPLDLANLLGELPEPAAASFGGLPEGTLMGHVHLKVAEIAPTVAFYRELLGFALMAALGDSAAFLSAGGYHHHIGANTWESAGGSPPAPGTAALGHFTIVLPDAEERDRLGERLGLVGIVPERRGDGLWLSDPSGNRMVLATAGQLLGPAGPEGDHLSSS